MCSQTCWSLSLILAMMRVSFCSASLVSSVLLPLTLSSCVLFSTEMFDVQQPAAPEGVAGGPLQLHLNPLEVGQPEAGYPPPQPQNQVYSFSMLPEAHLQTGVIPGGIKQLVQDWNKAAEVARQKALVPISVSGSGSGTHVQLRAQAVRTQADLPPLLLSHYRHIHPDSGDIILQMLNQCSGKTVPEVKTRVKGLAAEVERLTKALRDRDLMHFEHMQLYASNLRLDLISAAAHTSFAYTSRVLKQVSVIVSTARETVRAMGVLAAKYLGGGGGSSSSSGHPGGSIRSGKAMAVEFKRTAHSIFSSSALAGFEAVAMDNPAASAVERAAMAGRSSKADTAFEAAWADQSWQGVVLGPSPKTLHWKTLNWVKWGYGELPIDEVHPLMELCFSLKAFNPGGVMYYSTELVGLPELSPSDYKLEQQKLRSAAAVVSVQPGPKGDLFLVVIKPTEQKVYLYGRHSITRFTDYSFITTLNQVFEGCVFELEYEYQNWHSCQVISAALSVLESPTLKPDFNLLSSASRHQVKELYKWLVGFWVQPCNDNGNTLFLCEQVAHLKKHRQQLLVGMTEEERSEFETAPSESEAMRWALSFLTERNVELGEMETVNRNTAQQLQQMFGERLPLSTDPEQALEQVLAFLVQRDKQATQLEQQLTSSSGKQPSKKRKA